MNLQEFFTENPRVAIAFSGGVDSSYLLYAALHHGARARAYYVNSAFQPAFELEDARRLAGELNADMKVLPVDVLASEAVTANPPDRCYHCKQMIFRTILAAAEADGYTREQYDKALESMGMTADECVAAITDAFDMDTSLSLLGSGYADNTISAGYCKAEEGRLYFSSTTAFDEADFVGYTLAGGIMTWTDEDGALAGQLAPAEQVLMQFPAEWTKAAA